jgi:hypothetical protein
MYKLAKWTDRLGAGAQVAAGVPAQHSMIYVAAGRVSVNGTLLAAGQAFYTEDFLKIDTGSEAAELWRFGVVRDDSGLGLLAGSGVDSTLRMTRQVKMFEMVPTSRWLFRLDCIVGFEGTTGLHSHPGSGIRCLIDGYLRTESEKGENTVNSRRDDVWYEEGAYPLVSTVYDGIKTTFLRGMILPPQYLTYGETATWIEGAKAKYSDWKILEQSVVTLR